MHPWKFMYYRQLTLWLGCIHLICSMRISTTYKWRRGLKCSKKNVFSWAFCEFSKNKCWWFFVKVELSILTIVALHHLLCDAKTNWIGTKITHANRITLHKTIICWLWKDSVIRGTVCFSVRSVKGSFLKELSEFKGNDHWIVNLEAD